MTAAVQRRLAELRGELQRGQEELVALERRRLEVRDTVLRISGAIQVLEELADPARDDPAARVTPLSR